MATLRTRWLLSILMLGVSACAVTGPPAVPSSPMCFRPCDENACSVVIECTWDPKSDLKNPTNYSLHWMPAVSKDIHVKPGTSLDGRIPREQFLNTDLRVWVQAWNQNGSVKSEEVVFNTEDIIKPPPPEIISNQKDMTEIIIQWNSSCKKLDRPSSCDIRYRTEGAQAWPERDDTQELNSGSYTVIDPKPGRSYEFQVRCACVKSLVSNWSEIYKVDSAESKPVDEVDVWKDCGIYPKSSDCFLTWKNLSISQARGLILGYELNVYSNRIVELINVSTAKPSNQCVYFEMKWCLTTSLKNVSSVSISAYNSQGATEPSSLIIPVTGEEEEDYKVINLKMTEENLTVSWNHPFQFSDDLRGYVIQYKQAGCPLGQGFDWIKVDKGNSTVVFKGQFKKYTPYQVSLFAVSNSSAIHRLSSVIGYSLQKAPASVHSFTVSSIDGTDVTLYWEPDPLSKQTAHILYYQIGLDTQKEYNVSASLHDESMSFKLPDLSPGRRYEVWIRAVTEAGPGGNVTRLFNTNRHEGVGFLISVVTGSIALVLILLSACILWSVYQGENKVCPLMPGCLYEKVPDPRNSHIFKQMKHQINEPLGWICITVNEPQPKMSVLEVVEKTSLGFDPDRLTRRVAGDQSSEMEYQDEHTVTEETERTDRKYGKEAYSKMVDSDEDRGECWSSSEEDQVISGYEKHFMPTAVDICNV